MRGHSVAVVEERGETVIERGEKISRFQVRVQGRPRRDSHNHSGPAGVPWCEQELEVAQYHHGKGAKHCVVPHPPAGNLQLVCFREAFWKRKGWDGMGWDGRGWEGGDGEKGMGRGWEGGTEVQRHHTRHGMTTSKRNELTERKTGKACIHIMRHALQTKKTPKTHQKHV
jgi:hypothetical protein